MVCLSSLIRTEKKHALVTNSAIFSFRCFTVTKLKQFSRKVAPEPDCCFQGFMSHKSYGQQAPFPGKWDILQCLHFVSCNSSSYGFMVSPQAPNRKLIEKQNCPCATAVVQMISDHSKINSQHALLSHGQMQLDNYPSPSCL